MKSIVKLCNGSALDPEVLQLDRLVAFLDEPIFYFVGNESKRDYLEALSRDFNE